MRRFRRICARPVYYFNSMDPEDILELVKEGVIEPDQIEDFENLDPEIQELVADGDLDMDDAEGL